MRRLLMLALVAACKHSGPQPSPLGTLDAAELAKWQADCSTPLVEERVCGRFTPDKCEGHFHSLMPDKGAVIDDRPGSSATLKRSCASEGWGIWTDEIDRVVGFCIADAPGIANSVRMKQFVTRHRGEQIAQKIDHFTAGEDLDDSEYAWHAWDSFDMVPRPAYMGKQTCIEFRLLK
jgi:hypothetical protein